MSSLVRSCMELRNIFLRGWGTLKTAAVYHARLRTAHFVVQRIACGTFLYRGCNQTKGNPKTVGFWRRVHPFAAECKRMSRRSAKYSRRRQTCGRGCSPQSKNEKRALGTPAPAGCATEAARNDPRPRRGIPLFHLTTKAQTIATQGQLFPPRVIVFRQAASKCALTGCLLSAFVCVILGNDSTNRDL